MLELPYEVIWSENLYGEISSTIQFIDIFNSIVNYLQGNKIYFLNKLWYLCIFHGIPIIKVFGFTGVKLFIIVHFPSNFTRKS